MKIGGGLLRGRIIPVRNSPQTALRPTSDKMRQAIFNFLMHNPDILKICPDLDGAYVLDAFCGTGALGLEALSRGAAHATFFDTDRQALSDLKKLTADFKVEGQATIRNMSALRVPVSETPMQIIFLDPPYAKNMVAAAIDVLGKNGWTDQQTIFVCEVEKTCNDIPLNPLVDKTYGDSRLFIGHL